MKYYVASGSIRGTCRHKHKTLEAAAKCADQDRAAVRSLGGGAYSDRRAHVNTCRQVQAQNASCTCA